MATVVEQSGYILTDLAHNNNKFWRIELYDNGDCRTRWGRVGESGQAKDFPGAGATFYSQKCREKESKGYKPLRTLAGGVGPKSHRELEAVATEQIETNCPEVTRLIARLSQANVHNILNSTRLQYDTSSGSFSTPLGIVTQTAIEDARALLTRIGDFVHAGCYDDRQFMQAAADYLMLVPQDIGRSKPDLKRLYPDLEAVQAQNGILDALEASLQNVLSDPKNERPVGKLFSVKLHRVEAGREIERIRRKYRETAQTMHACAHLDVKALYAVEIASMRDTFTTQGRPLGNVWELWHGTKVANLLSILKTGLRVAPPRSAHITGKAFGNGIYFSDQSTKSLNYAYGYSDGRPSDNCFMFLCDVAMGRYYVPQAAFEPLPKPNTDSTFAQARRSGVQNNEMIVYRDSQVDIKLLVEFDRAERRWRFF